MSSHVERLNMNMGCDAVQYWTLNKLVNQEYHKKIPQVNHIGYDSSSLFSPRQILTNNMQSQPPVRHSFRLYSHQDSQHIHDRLNSTPFVLHNHGSQVMLFLCQRTSNLGCQKMKLVPHLVLPPYFPPRTLITLRSTWGVPPSFLPKVPIKQPTGQPNSSKSHTKSKKSLGSSPWGPQTPTIPISNESTSSAHPIESPSHSYFCYSTTLSSQQDAITSGVVATTYNLNSECSCRDLRGLGDTTPHGSGLRKTIAADKCGVIAVMYSLVTAIYLVVHTTDPNEPTKVLPPREHSLAYRTVLLAYIPTPPGATCLAITHGFSAQKSDSATSADHNPSQGADASGSSHHRLQCRRLEQSCSYHVIFGTSQGLVYYILSSRQSLHALRFATHEDQQLVLRGDTAGMGRFHVAIRVAHCLQRIAISSIAWATHTGSTFDNSGQLSTLQRTYPLPWLGLTTVDGRYCLFDLYPLYYQHVTSIKGDGSPNPGIPQSSLVVRRLLPLDHGDIDTCVLAVVNADISDSQIQPNALPAEMYEAVLKPRALSDQTHGVDDSLPHTSGPCSSSSSPSSLTTCIVTQPSTIVNQHVKLRGFLRGSYTHYSTNWTSPQTAPELCRVVVFLTYTDGSILLFQSLQLDRQMQSFNLPLVDTLTGTKVTRLQPAIELFSSLLSHINLPPIPAQIAYVHNQGGDHVDPRIARPHTGQTCGISHPPDTPSSPVSLLTAPNHAPSIDVHPIHSTEKDKTPPHTNIATTLSNHTHIFGQQYIYPLAFAPIHYSDDLPTAKYLSQSPSSQGLLSTSVGALLNIKTKKADDLPTPLQLQTSLQTTTVSLNRSAEPIQGFCVDTSGHTPKPCSHQPTLQQAHLAFASYHLFPIVSLAHVPNKTIISSVIQQYPSILPAPQPCIELGRDIEEFLPTFLSIPLHAIGWFATIVYVSLPLGRSTPGSSQQCQQFGQHLDPIVTRTPVLCFLKPVAASTGRVHTPHTSSLVFTPTQLVRAVPLLPSQIAIGLTHIHHHILVVFASGEVLSIPIPTNSGEGIASQYSTQHPSQTHGVSGLLTGKTNTATVEVHPLQRDVHQANYHMCLPSISLSSPIHSYSVDNDVAAAHQNQVYCYSSQPVSMTSPIHYRVAVAHQGLCGSPHRTQLIAIMNASISTPHPPLVFMMLMKLHDITPLQTANGSANGNKDAGFHNTKTEAVSAQHSSTSCLELVGKMPVAYPLVFSSSTQHIITPCASPEQPVEIHLTAIASIFRPWIEIHLAFSSHPECPSTNTSPLTESAMREWRYEVPLQLVFPQALQSCRLVQNGLHITPLPPITTTLAAFHFQSESSSSPLAVPTLARHQTCTLLPYLCSAITSTHLIIWSVLYTVNVAERIMGDAGNLQCAIQPQVYFLSYAPHHVSPPPADPPTPTMLLPPFAIIGTSAGCHKLMESSMIGKFLHRQVIQSQSHCMQCLHTALTQEDGHVTHEPTGSLESPKQQEPLTTFPVLLLGIESEKQAHCFHLEIPFLDMFQQWRTTMIHEQRQQQGVAPTQTQRHHIPRVVTLQSKVESFSFPLSS